MKKLILLICLSFSSYLGAQPTFPYNGVADPKERLYAFVGATVFNKYDKPIENATLIIRDGIIQEVGTDLKLPTGAIVVDVKGKYIYPSLIETYSNYGLPEVVAAKRAETPQMLSNREGAYSWNDALKSDFRAYQVFKNEDKTAENMRKNGFGTVVTHRYDGIARGTSLAVGLGTENENLLVLKENTAAHYSFSKGSSIQDYPSSLMGAIALLRQTYYDAQWYTSQKGKAGAEFNISLDAWLETQKLPQVFETTDKLNVLRADKIGDEFNVQYIFKTTGDEYQRIQEIKNTKGSLIVGINFPKATDLSDPYDALNIGLSSLKHWELAPTNPANIAKAGINFALTAHGCESLDIFWANLRKAIEYGLNKNEALKALTIAPAELMGIADKVGSLEKGKWANFIITSGDIFEKDIKIYENWVRGNGFVINRMTNTNVIGKYNFKIENTTYNLVVKGTNENPIFQIGEDSAAIQLKHTIDGKTISLQFNPNKKQKNKLYRLSGIINQEAKTMLGQGVDENGNWLKWEANFVQNLDPEKKKEDKKEVKPLELGTITYPFEAYGYAERPKTGHFLFKNATVWTSEKEGILENTDVLVQNGKIQKIGKNLSANGATAIDATGKHLTAGIIDEHSHICISRGVNEGTQSSTAEVRIGDVVDSEDADIYKQLAGGVIACHLLHGSANCIGGQSQLIKLRWGYAPEEMKMANWDGFIKFALGENVKQSNWGDNATTRFPQTRMGVEQIFDDYFTQAKEYDKKRQAGIPVRRDLELDALAEILNKKRFITCHSYVQSEINMLMKIAEKHQFRLNTFTHILEGYKVADKMKAHGVGASTFSDWWAYKPEVWDAIPYNAFMLNKMGIITAINSDDAEMARRLNQEAAKSVKYGGMSEIDAWNMVTINPAKLLHVDKQTGSIKEGKDADIVIWSANPLSIYAHAEKTFVDGILFFDIEKDKLLREEVKKERARLTQKMLQEKGADAKKPEPSTKKRYHCEDIHDELSEIKN